LAVLTGIQPAGAAYQWNESNADQIPLPVRIPGRPADPVTSHNVAHPVAPAGSAKF
jgi:hypothetical protein